VWKNRSDFKKRFDGSAWYPTRLSRVMNAIVPDARFRVSSDAAGQSVGYDARRWAAATGRMRILVVEDEQKVAQALRAGLQGEGYEVVLEPTGEGAYFRVNTEAFDVIVLDVMLPGRDGLQVLARIRERGIKTPVLVLTARDTLADRVSGLDSGADDYLVKPFAFAELLARIRALLRRGRAADTLRLRIADLNMDLVSRKVTRAGKALELTVREFELLHYLLQHEGQVVSRDALVHQLWHEPARSATLDNVIDVHIARLRRKVDLDQPVKLIHTVRGVGFVLREDEP
jgi:two-component system copper resistance phosphate regulon response regulator CusR